MFAKLLEGLEEQALGRASRNKSQNNIKDWLTEGVGTLRGPEVQGLQKQCPSCQQQNPIASAVICANTTLTLALGPQEARLGTAAVKPNTSVTACASRSRPGPQSHPPACSV